MSWNPAGPTAAASAGARGGVPGPSGRRNISGPSVGAGVGSTALSDPGATSIDPSTIDARIADRRKRERMAERATCPVTSPSVPRMSVTANSNSARSGHKSRCDDCTGPARYRTCGRNASVAPILFARGHRDSCSRSARAIQPGRPGLVRGDIRGADAGAGGGLGGDLGRASHADPRPERAAARPLPRSSGRSTASPRRRGRRGRRSSPEPSGSCTSRRSRP